MASAPKKATAKAVTNPMKAEATEEGVTFEFEGDSYTVPTTDDWSLEAVEAMEDGKGTTLVREVLGPDQWEHFKTNKKRTVRDLNALSEVIRDALGITGN